MEYRIVLDVPLLVRYYKYYFIKHPNRRKQVITSPIPESLNAWMVMKRPQMNALKQYWRELMVWVAMDAGLMEKNIEKYKLKVTYYLPTKSRRDPDNMTPKFLLDGLVDANFLVDDSWKNCRELIIRVRYDKDNPRTEIEVTDLDEED